MISESKKTEYYENPNVCEHCGKIIEIKNERSLSDVKRKRFCNKSCANAFNTKGTVRNKNGSRKVSDNTNTICPNCGERKSSTATVCSKC